MKKYFALLLVIVLLLAGCSNGDAEMTENVPPKETIPEGRYHVGSKLETETEGAVRQYDLPQGSFAQLAVAGDRQLVVSESEPAQLYMLSGDEGIPTTASLPEGAKPTGCQAVGGGFMYYDEAKKQAVVLDAHLQELHRFDLPEDISGSPVFSPDGSGIFFSVGQEIYCMDTQNRLPRRVRSFSAAEQTLLGSCFGGKMLICQLKDTEGNTETQYISAEDGQTVCTDNSLELLYTCEDRYFAQRTDGGLRQRIIGTRSGEAAVLEIPEELLAEALALGGMIGYSVEQTGLQLNFYALDSGKKTAAVLLPGIAEPKAILADKTSGYIWLLAATPEGDVLLRWDRKESAVQEDATCLAPLYTAENPDTPAINALQERIEQINTACGVRICIWQEAVKTTGGHTLVAEHQVSAIVDMLDQLEAALKEFPKGFVSKSIKSKVRICLVRSANGQQDGIQFWNGKNAYIALCSGSDIRTEFMKNFGLVIDSHVLGNSPKYDYWDTLNPEGFVYGTQVDEALLSGEKRAFVDADSMTSAPMDRSRVFWQAMQPDNAELFKGEAMQKKLKMLCQAIRDAWNLKKSAEIFPWEQYLEKPIAYNKK